MTCYRLRVPSLQSILLITLIVQISFLISSEAFQVCKCKNYGPVLGCAVPCPPKSPYSPVTYPVYDTQDCCQNYPRCSYRRPKGNRSPNINTYPYLASTALASNYAPQCCIPECPKPEPKCSPPSKQYIGLPYYLPYPVYCSQPSNPTCAATPPAAPSCACKPPPCPAPAPPPPPPPCPPKIKISLLEQPNPSQPPVESCSCILNADEIYVTQDAVDQVTENSINGLLKEILALVKSVEVFLLKIKLLPNATGLLSGLLSELLPLIRSIEHKISSPTISLVLKSDIVLGNLLKVAVDLRVKISTSALIGDVDSLINEILCLVQNLIELLLGRSLVAEDNSIIVEILLILQNIELKLQEEPEKPKNYCLCFKDNDKYPIGTMSPKTACLDQLVKLAGIVNKPIPDDDDDGGTGLIGGIVGGLLGGGKFPNCRRIGRRFPIGKLPGGKKPGGKLPGKAPPMMPPDDEEDDEDMGDMDDEDDLVDQDDMDADDELAYDDDMGDPTGGSKMIMKRSKFSVFNPKKKICTKSKKYNIKNPSFPGTIYNM